MSDRYARDPIYGKPPQWGRLYGKHCPRDTDGSSRHTRMIAEETLRDPKSPVRQWLIDQGYEPDHWASSLEVTVKALWETRAELWRVDPVGQQRKQDREIAALNVALPRTQHDPNIELEVLDGVRAIPD